jgi:hypothetical protein
LGQWRHGELFGWAGLFFKDGSVLIGEWVNGICHGFGMFMTPDGIVQSGVWRQGQCTFYDHNLWSLIVQQSACLIPRFSKEYFRCVNINQSSQFKHSPSSASNTFSHCSFCGCRCCCCSCFQFRS